jgi:hypothetical protein
LNNRDLTVGKDETGRVKGTLRIGGKYRIEMVVCIVLAAHGACMLSTLIGQGDIIVTRGNSHSVMMRLSMTLEQYLNHDVSPTSQPHRGLHEMCAHSLKKKKSRLLV